jgi:hypothetical protein
MQSFLNNILLVARPLLAFKRDLSRPTSETRVPSDQESATAYRTRQESTSSSSALEISDIDTSSSFKSIFDKVKNTLSPSTKRRTSENTTIDETKIPSRESRNSSIISLSSKSSQKHRLHHHKSVSFAENVDNDYDSDNNQEYSINDRNEIVRNAQTLADQILMASIDEATNKSASKNILSNIKNYDDDDDNFERDFHLTIKPRRILNDNKEDLVYQDLSAEIVAYVLKHALRTVKKEQEQLVVSTAADQDDDFIDLK